MPVALSSPQRSASEAPELHTFGMGMDGQENSSIENGGQEEGEDEGEERARRQRRPLVFLFFSNRFGCLGSIVISVVLSALLILVMRGCLGTKF